MKYIYYRLWKLLSKIPTNDQPATNALIILTTFEMANVSTVRIILNYYYGEIVSEFYSRMLVYAVIPYLIVFLINYFYLYVDREILDIVYKDETKTKRRIGMIWLFGYAIVTILLIAYFGPKYSVNLPS
jgi:Na+/H+ antiporter NhaD/arsenite permease-like protein